MNRNKLLLFEEIKNNLPSLFYDTFILFFIQWKQNLMITSAVHPEQSSSIKRAEVCVQWSGLLTLLRLINLWGWVLTVRHMEVSIIIINHFQ